MRNAAAVIVLALLIPSLRAANVEVARPRIAFLSETEAALACKGPSRRGCTTVVTQFICGCARKADDVWTLTPRFIATPYVYTTTQQVIRHEMEHIADVRSSLNEYASALALRTFSTESACRTFVVEEQKLFSTTLRNMQRLTTMRRDGVQVAHRYGGQE